MMFAYTLLLLSAKVVFEMTHHCLSLCQEKGALNEYIAPSFTKKGKGTGSFTKKSLNFSPGESKWP